MGWTELVVRDQLWNLDSIEGTWDTAPLVTPTRVNTSRSSLVDVDGDGDLDAMFGFCIPCGEDFGDVTGQNIGWSENVDGTGTFGDLQIIASWQDNVDFGKLTYAGDIDGDGDQDVATRPRGWYENLDGKGTFSELIPTPSDERFALISDLDIDGDGRFDSLIADGNRFYIVYDITNIRSFDDPVFVTESLDSQPRLLDWDQDGDVDIVTQYRGTSHYFENLGERRFDVGRQISDPSYWWNRLADFDNDGDIDLLRSRFDGVTWRPNVDEDLLASVRSAPCGASQRHPRNGRHRPRW